MSRLPPARLVGALLLREGRLLLGKRSRKKREWPNAWDVPGGHVEPGETFAEALLREIEEEIGVVPRGFAFLADCWTAEGEPYRIFRVDAWDGGEPAMRNKEHSRLGWFTPAEACALRPLADKRYVQLFSVVGATLRRR